MLDFDMQRIDAHLHLLGDDGATLALLDRLDLGLINVCVALEADWRDRGGCSVQKYRALAETRPDRYAWVTSFDVPRASDRDYGEKVIAGIDEDLALGAVGVKVWKNIGMEARKEDGGFILVDDPLFEPIFRHLETVGTTLLMHIADPIACWRPLCEENPHVEYYRANPQWHLHGRPEYPSHEQLIAARDRVVARHPRLRVVGAHLGSLEHDLPAVARRLEAYPNFAVDLSSRIVDLLRYDSDVVRRFLIRYADRVLFGTDVGGPRFLSEFTAEERTRQLNSWERNWRDGFSYFETSGPVNMAGTTAPGLGLPAAVVERLFLHNALHWYPALQSRWQ